MKKIKLMLVAVLAMFALVACGEKPEAPKEILEGFGQVLSVEPHASSECENYDYVAVIATAVEGKATGDNVQIVIGKDDVNGLKALIGSKHPIKFQYEKKRGINSCSFTYANLVDYTIQ